MRPKVFGQQALLQDPRIVRFYPKVGTVQGGKEVQELVQQKAQRFFPIPSELLVQLVELLILFALIGAMLQV